MFGKIEGKIDSEFWAVLSKPKKEYGRKTYTRKERFGNPYRVNANYIENLALKTNKEYLNYVVEKLSLKKDMLFDNKVIEAHFDEKSNLWNIKTNKDKTNKS